MAIRYDDLLALRIPEVVRHYTAKDCILYALGLGFGQNPLDPGELAFVRGSNPNVMLTCAAVFGYPYRWFQELDTGFDWRQTLHGEQSLTMHRPMAAAGRLVCRLRVVDVADKGAGKGAVVYGEHTLHDDRGLVATMGFSLFCRADGGFGGPLRAGPALHAIPDRAPDYACDLPTRPEAALIYSLSGDDNPMHSDPVHARAAGFPRPVLHGLASYGIAARAIIKTLCGDVPEKLIALAGRFSAPVFPGETLRTEMWRDGSIVSFRLRAVERDVVAFNNGRAELAA